MVHESPPAVPLSFANNFWGFEDKGVPAIFQRMKDAKQTCEEVRLFYKERISIEEEYARRLNALSRKGLGSRDTGTLKASLDTVRRETEQTAKAHSSSANQLKSEIEAPLTAFASSIRERRKVVQTTLDKLHKAKLAQQQNVLKAQEKYEADCNKINGYIAQQNMVMGRELEKNNAKLEKVQSTVLSSRRDYQMSLKALAETIERWNREWKLGCDKFQDLEEERIDFLKNSVWNYANVLATVCVSDDEYCENIRLALERCDIEQDIVSFVKDRATGQEIPDAPEYINFMDGTSAYRNDRDSYSLAQFPRQGNPQYRSSDQIPKPTETAETEAPANTKRSSQLDIMIASLSMNNRNANQSSSASVHTSPSYGSQLNESLQSTPKTRSKAVINPMESNIVLAPPEDAMSSAHSSPVQRPRSLSAGSDISQPTTVSSGSEEELSTPVRVRTFDQTANQVAAGLHGSPSPEKKKSSWTSPFRRRSKNESPSGWASPESSRSNSPTKGDSIYGSSPDKSPGRFMRHTKSAKSLGSQRSVAAEAEAPNPRDIDQAEQYVLNVGDNSFEVSPSKMQVNMSTKNEPTLANSDPNDPIAAALANLKNEETRPHTKVYGLEGTGQAISMRPSRRVPSYSAPASPQNRGTKMTNAGPPPKHNETSASLLVPPAPAMTSAEMEQTSNEYAMRTQHMFDDRAPPISNSRQNLQQQPQMRRPQSSQQMYNAMPQQRRPPSSQMYAETRPPQQRRPPSSQQMHERPRPASQAAMNSQYSPQGYQQRPGYGNSSPTQGVMRDVSPSPARGDRSPNAPRMAGRMRPRSAMDNADYRAGQRGQARPVSRQFMGHPSNGRVSPNPNMQTQSNLRSMNDEEALRDASRMKSKSAMDIRQATSMDLPARTQDGQEVISYARAMYDYRAMIPEEVSFRKGDYLLVALMQEDGWWEVEVYGPRTRPHMGLAPSNYLQRVSRT
ncbi:uncharacterized protein V1516DRAFT_626912 [Lipomyces oligophaga]|uniref:uncharacterized protein n=1 Tax=Lipomyces oligophaga TaxID=45792 RepID=UPI0034CD5F82